jgi:hypothetical protein
MRFATPRSIKNTSLKLFNKEDERLILLYNYLVDICNFGTDEYHKLETKYHDLYHFLTSTTVFLDVYSGIVDKQIIEKNESDFFCGVVATMYHDIGFLKTKEDENGTGAQYINTHVERGCHFISNNFDDILTEEEKSRICNLIMVTDYFKKVENLEIDHIGACVALGDWLSQMGDIQYVEKLDKLYQEFDEFQKYHNLNMYTGLHDLISKTPGFWYKLVKPLLNTKFYALYEYTSSNYIVMVENNIDRIVKEYNLNHVV